MCRSATSWLFLLVGLLLADRGVAAEAASFTGRLEALAAKCDELKLPREAEITRGWIIPRHPGRQYLFLPSVSDPTAPAATASEVAKKWYAKFLEYRAEQAEMLFAEAKKSLDANQPARAYQLLFETLRENPDHAEARRILGYTKGRGGQWTTPEWERTTVKVVKGPHPKLGWPSYWRLEGPHFEIVTNAGEGEAREASRQLEDLYVLWQQAFFCYWANQAGLAARFAGGKEPLARPRPKMQVAIFKIARSMSPNLRQRSLRSASRLAFISIRITSPASMRATSRSIPPGITRRRTSSSRKACPASPTSPAKTRIFGPSKPLPSTWNR